jgi:hypothetical protein
LSSNTGTNCGIDSFGFNTANSVSLANISGPAGWGLQTTQNQDGFGNFTSAVNYDRAVSCRSTDVQHHGH